MNLSNETIIHIKKEKIEYIQFRKLLEYEDIITHAYTLRTNLDFKRASEKIMLESYEKLGKELSFSLDDIVRPVQSHTDNVEIANKTNLEKEYVCYANQFNNVDGLITNEKKIVLSTTSADCISFLFFDPNTNVIANVHSGWRGTLQKIALKTVQKMVFQEGCKAKDILCFICPSIRKCHFEVEEDVAKKYEEEFSNVENIEKLIKYMGIKNEVKKWNIDTIEINKNILEKFGLKRENIIDSNICTVCNKKEFHSYRGEGKLNGLNTAIIVLK